MSLDCKLYRMPFVPILIPSLTPIVLNCMPTKPAFCTLFLIAWLRSKRCMLQGLPLNQTDEMPTWAFLRSASLRPSSLGSRGVARHLEADWEKARTEFHCARE